MSKSNGSGNGGRRGYAKALKRSALPQVRDAAIAGTSMALGSLATGAVAFAMAKDADDPEKTRKIVRGVGSGLLAVVGLAVTPFAPVAGLGLLTGAGISLARMASTAIDKEGKVTGQFKKGLDIDYGDAEGTTGQGSLEQRVNAKLMKHGIAPAGVQARPAGNVVQLPTASQQPQVGESVSSKIVRVA